MAEWHGRDWDEIPMSSWDHATPHIHEDGTFGIEFDYTGFNNRHYHFPEQEISFEDFLDIYDELVFWDVEFEIEYG